MENLMRNKMPTALSQP